MCMNSSSAKSESDVMERKQSIKKMGHHRVAAFLCMIICEVVLSQLITRGEDWSCLKIAIMSATALLSAVAVVVIISCYKNEFRIPSSNVLKKVLSFDDYPWLSLMIMIAFLAQLTWFFDSLFNIMFVDSGVVYWKAWLNVLLTVIISFALLRIYPYYKRNTELVHRSHIYSGLSSLPSGSCQYRNIDLLVKPLITQIDDERMSDTNSGRFLLHLKKLTIFPSKDFKFDFQLVPPLKDKDGIYEEFINIMKSQSRTDYEEAESVREVYDARYKKKVRQGGEEIEVEFMSFAAEGSKFAALIKLFARIAVSKNTSYSEETKNEIRRLLSELEIKVLPPELDYDNFQDSFAEIDRNISSQDEECLIYISPGTANLTGILTSFGMKGNRMILYHHQGKDKVMAINLDSAMEHIRRG